MLTGQQVKIEGDKLRVSFGYNADFISRLKELQWRRFDPQTKAWVVRNDEESRALLDEFGFVIEDISDYDPFHALKLKDPERLSVMKSQLRKYQAQGVAAMEQTNGCMLLADEMGLGKTIQAIAYLKLHPEKFPALVVCPASLKYNWRNEFKRHADVDCDIVTTETPGIPLFGRDKRPLIINYDILHRYKDYFEQHPFKTVIFDESHYIKNPKSRRTKMALSIANLAESKIFLTGTPMLNRPVELWPVLSCLTDAFTSWWHFVQRYCDPKHTRFGWTFNGATNVSELHSKVKGFMLRRKKSEVLKQLPAKAESFVPMELENPDVYLKSLETLIKNKAGRKLMEESELSDLQYIIAKQKMKSVMSWIDDFLDTGEKLVLFNVHRKIGEELHNTYAKCSVRLYGDTPIHERQNAVDRFQTDPKIKLFIGNIQAAGVGITLTASSTVAFVEFPWTPGALAQACDRVHRIGQENPVDIFYLVGLDTFEEKVVQMLSSKAKVINAVLHGSCYNGDTSTLDEILNLIKRG